MFSTQKQITVEVETTLENYKIEILPNIGVITGSYDNIESVLYGIGLVNPITGLPLFDIIDGITTNRTTTNKHYRGKNNGMANRNPILNPKCKFFLYRFNV